MIQPTHDEARDEVARRLSSAISCRCMYGTGRALADAIAQLIQVEIGAVLLEVSDADG